MVSNIFTVFFLLVLIASRLLAGQSIGILIAYLTTLLAASAIREHQKRRRESFINQLKSQRPALRSGGTVVIDQHLLRYHSKLTSYRMSFGALLSSVQVSSQYYVSTGTDHPQSLLYSLVSMVFGWWHVPTGPIETLGIIKLNLSGGEQTTVAELIDAELIALKKQEVNELLINLARGTEEPKPIVTPKPIASTGPDSPSMKLLSAKKPEPTTKSLEQRIQDVGQNPTWAKEALSSVAKQSREKLKELIEKSEKKRNLKASQPVQNTQLSSHQKKTS